jgi:hypothetical protein
MTVSWAVGRLDTGMTTEVLTRLLMRAWETSTLALEKQAEALGTAYASFLTSKGSAAAELRDLLNRVILVIDDIERKKSIN